MLTSHAFASVLCHTTARCRCSDGHRRGLHTSLGTIRFVAGLLRHNLARTLTNEIVALADVLEGRAGARAAFASDLNTELKRRVRSAAPCAKHCVRASSSCGRHPSKTLDGSCSSWPHACNLS